MIDRRKELEQELENIQGEIEKTLSEIRDDITGWTDIKYWIHRYPFQLIGGSMLLGLILSGLTGRKAKRNTSGSDSGDKFAGLLFSELRKLASKRAAKMIVELIEDNLEKKKKEQDL